MARVAYVARGRISTFEDSCGCVFSRDNDGEPFVIPCAGHAPVAAQTEACDDCGWEETGPPNNRDEFQLCNTHWNLWKNAKGKPQ